MANESLRLTRDAIAVFVGMVLCFGGIAVLGPNWLLPAATADPGCFQDPPPSDPDDDYGSMSVEEQSGGSSQTSLSGFQGRAWVGSGAVPCGRIQSVYIRTASFSGIAEFGWAKGWFSCFGRAGSYTQYGYVHPFYVSKDGFGNEYCWEFPNRPLSADTTHLFRASDLDENGYWGPWLDGDALTPGLYLSFHQGIGGVNAERQNEDDPMFAHFQYINEAINGSWSPTDNLGDPYDTDPDYRIVIDSSNEVHFTR